MNKSILLILSVFCLAACEQVLKEDVSIKETSITYNITFNSNGGSGVMQNQTVNDNKSHLICKCTLIKQNYNFIGWNTKADGSGTQYHDQQPISLTNDITLYAQWKIISYSVFFNPNNGTGYMDYQSFEHGSSKQIKPNTYTRENYRFMGWNTAYDGSGIHYDDQQSISINNDIYLFAEWELVIYKSVLDLTNAISNMTMSGTVALKCNISRSDLILICLAIDSSPINIILDLEKCTDITDLLYSDLSTSPFSGLENLIGISIPESITAMAWTFNNCQNLESIKLTNKLITIGDCTFTNIKRLTTINLPEGLITIGARAFHGCTSLSSINIPENVNWIGLGAFSGSAIKTINIPIGVNEIQRETFNDCKYLKSINMLAVKTIGESAFQNCSALESISLSNNLTTIDARSFENCTSLRNIEIPGTVQNIGSCAFKNSGLISIKINDGLSELGRECFLQCTDLTNITLPSSLLKICEYALWNCASLESLVIPENVNYIESIGYCPSLKYITIQNPIPPILAEGAFSQTQAAKLIYVPKESLVDYQNSLSWSDYADYLQAY